MCEQKPKKLFWLDQIHEIEWQAKELVKAGRSKNPVIDTEIWLFKQGQSQYKTKEELQDRIVEIIKGITTPREKSGGKFKEQTLFKEQDLF